MVSRSTNTITEVAKTYYKAKTIKERSSYEKRNDLIKVQLRNIGFTIRTIKTFFIFLFSCRSLAESSWQDDHDFHRPENSQAEVKDGQCPDSHLSDTKICLKIKQFFRFCKQKKRTDVKSLNIRMFYAPLHLCIPTAHIHAYMST